ncbi:hypothetical protein U0070_017703, partial [Myodes glareolus]
MMAGEGALGAEPRLRQGWLGGGAGDGARSQGAAPGRGRYAGRGRASSAREAADPGSRERRAGLRCSTRLQRGWRTRWQRLLRRRRRSGFEEGTAGLERLQRVGKHASKFQFVASYQELMVECTKK